MVRAQKETDFKQGAAGDGDRGNTHLKFIFERQQKR